MSNRKNEIDFLSSFSYPASSEKTNAPLRLIKNCIVGNLDKIQENLKYLNLFHMHLVNNNNNDSDVIFKKLCQTNNVRLIDCMFLNSLIDNRHNTAHVVIKYLEENDQICKQFLDNYSADKLYFWFNKEITPKLVYLYDKHNIQLDFYSCLKAKYKFNPDAFEFVCKYYVNHPTIQVKILEWILLEQNTQCLEIFQKTFPSIAHTFSFKEIIINQLEICGRDKQKLNSFSNWIVCLLNHNFTVEQMFGDVYELNTLSRDYYCKSVVVSFANRTSRILTIFRSLVYIFPNEIIRTIADFMPYPDIVI